jgi:hypothetical protein
MTETEFRTGKPAPGIALELATLLVSARHAVGAARRELPALDPARLETCSLTVSDLARQTAALVQIVADAAAANAGTAA